MTTHVGGAALGGTPAPGEGLAEARAAPRPVARYEYRDADRTLRYVVTRHTPKGFTIAAADGSPLPDPVPREMAVLYRLPELLAAPPGVTVYVAEGEKDADTLAGLGLVATTMPCGTRMGWLDSYTPHLAGRHVVIFPDADGPGRRHAAAVEDALAAVTCSCVVVDLHDGTSGPWDVTDWLSRRYRGKNELLAAVGAARLKAAGYERPRRDGTPLPRDQVEFIYGSTVDATGKLVLLARCKYPHASASRIASACSLHRVTVQNTITRLRAMGVLDGDWIDWGILATATY
jgi:hypothetical protein